MRHANGSPIERPVLDSRGGFILRSVLGGVEMMTAPEPRAFGIKDRRKTQQLAPLSGKFFSIKKM